MIKRFKEEWFYGLLVLGLTLFFGFVLATVPIWQGEGSNYSALEDIPYYHNLSANISGNFSQVSFAINVQSPIYNLTWTNASGTYVVNTSDVPWITMINTTTGNLSINATFDNQTGYFTVPIANENTTTVEADGSTVSFKFIVNATNDAPVFTDVNTSFNLTMNEYFSKYLNGTDEEEHTPLLFNVTFNGTCTHASWSGRNADENCSLIGIGMNFTQFSNYSQLMNFTPVRNDVGEYWANVSVMDSGINYPCPHAFCVNDTYKQNQTTYYSSMVLFNVFSSLDVNASNCTDKVFQENVLNWCVINVTTKQDTDDLNLSTYSILRNYASGQAEVVNTSWFYPSQNTAAANFFKQINVTVNATKRELGNWTINFTIHDFTQSQNYTAQINILANRSVSLNDAPDLIAPSNLNTSISLGNVINLSVYDDDLLIPDKNSSFGGYNETITFNRSVYNLSSGVELNLSNFTIAIVNMPVSGTNRTLAQLRFTANSSEVGSYKINITAADVNGAVNFETFNLTVINNNAPQWSATVNTTPIYWEGNNTSMNLSLNVSDADVSDTLTFSYTNDTAFPSFDLASSTGIINFTSNDSDVGYHIMNITVSDGYLTDMESFNFTILNINDSLSIDNLIVAGASPDPLTSGGNLTATEDNYTNFTLLIQDDDLRIPSVQISKGHYNETFNFNLTIQGINDSLFNFSLADRVFLPFANKSRYTASFTPRKADIGNYNVTLNISDLSGNFALFTFNMTINEIDHNPVLSTLENQSSAVNRTLAYNLNVTDTENGNDTGGGVNTNFTFNYTLLSDGRVDVYFNSTEFNSTIGLFNVTFNNTQAGKYHINFTVNDSTNRIDFQDIWFYVYGLPNITSPSIGTTFNLTENTTSILNFTANHSVGDNLTYTFYVDSISSNGSYTYGSLVLKNLTSYYGNGSVSYNWSFMSNFSDETYAMVKNLTIIVYPNSSSLENASLLNSSFNFKLNISHTNYPISISDQIDDKGPTTYGTDIAINLANHFSDPDSSDYAYNQTPTFTASSNGSTITKTFLSWILTLSSAAATMETIGINASDGSSSIVSDNFTVTFIAPASSTTDSPSSGGGGGITNVPVSLKIIMPDPVSAYQKDRIELPLTLHNTGNKPLYGITLNGTTAKDGALTPDVSVSFSNISFPILESGKKINLTMTVFIDTEEMGLFEITVDANVKTPKYHDWGKLYLTVKEGESVREKLLFTEEFIVDNPECAELTELIDEAKRLASIGDNAGSIKKAEEALGACKEILEQAARPGLRQVIENKLYRYLAIASVVAFAGGIAYYSYKRMKLKRTRGTWGNYVQEDIKNKKYLD